MHQSLAEGGALEDTHSDQTTDQTIDQVSDHGEHVSDHDQVVQPIDPNAVDGNSLHDHVLSKNWVRREFKPPSRFAHMDVIAYALNVGGSIELEEPLNYAATCWNKDKDKWLLAMKEEMASLRKNYT